MDNFYVLVLHFFFVLLALLMMNVRFELWFKVHSKKLHPTAENKEYTTDLNQFAILE